MDYGRFLASHADRDADMTVSCVEMPIEEAAGQMGVMTVDENWRVIGFDEKPAKPNPIPGKPDLCLASMGNYIFNTEFLYEQVIKDADTPDTQHDFGRNLIPAIIQDYRVYAYPFRDPETEEQAYWRGFLLPCISMLRQSAFRGSNQRRDIVANFVGHL